jgi:hypothetical protein
VRPLLTADASSPVTWPVVQTHLCLNLDCWNCVARLTDFSVDAPRSPPQLAVAVSPLRGCLRAGRPWQTETESSNILDLRTV